MKKITPETITDRLVEIGDEAETAKSRAGYLVGLLTPRQLVGYFSNRRQGVCHERAYSLAQRGQTIMAPALLAEFPGWQNETMQ